MPLNQKAHLAFQARIFFSGSQVSTVRLVSSPVTGSTRGFSAVTPLSSSIITFSLRSLACSHQHSSALKPLLRGTRLAGGRLPISCRVYVHLRDPWRSQSVQDWQKPLQRDMPSNQGVGNRVYACTGWTAAYPDSPPVQLPLAKPTDVEQLHPAPRAAPLAGALSLVVPSQALMTHDSDGMLPTLQREGFESTVGPDQGDTKACDLYHRRMALCPMLYLASAHVLLPGGKHPQ